MMMLRDEHPVCRGDQAYSMRDSVGPISGRPVVVGICCTCNKWVFVQYLARHGEPIWHTTQGHPLAEVAVP